MAKCVKKGDYIRRVPDEKAAELVKDDGWHYVPKSTWRRLDRENDRLRRA